MSGVSLLNPLLCLLVLLVVEIAGHLPYNPSFIGIPPQQNGSLAYILNPDPSASGNVQLQSLDLSRPLNSSQLQTNDLSVPDEFHSDDGTVALPAVDTDGTLTVYTGNCRTKDAEVWKFSPPNGYGDGKGTWRKSNLEYDKSDTATGPNYLASSIAYSSENSQPASIYVFGGMCPMANSSGSDWVTAANYSRSMLSLSPGSSASESSYSAEMVTIRGPPVAEAGFSMTPLVPAYSNTSTGKQLRQQSFVLIGGHTENAFINMSQVALFSLPESSWSYIPVNQEKDNLPSELVLDGITGIEPRSGHAAVLSPDGTKIIVFGGWVGDVTVPAQPQLAILDVGEDYGGSGDWAWRFPQGNGHALESGAGLFGHGAAMLPGGVMVVTGGYDIPIKSTKRSAQGLSSNQQLYFFNTTSETWATSYTNPNVAAAAAAAQSKEGSGPLSSPSQKAGLGVGLGVGLSAVAGALLFLYCVRSRHSREHRRAREQELRRLALGAERPHVDMGDMNYNQDMAQIQAQPGNPLVPVDAYSRVSSSAPRGGNVWNESGASAAERTGLLVEIPSPTRGLRRSMHSRSYHENSRNSQALSKIHPIDECDEIDELDEETENFMAVGPELNRMSVVSDPFVDPPAFAQPETLPFNRMSIEARDVADDFRNIPAASDATETRSNSPDKSDRTLSDLSEASGSGLSMTSQNTNPGYLNRNLSRMFGLRSQNEAPQFGASIFYQPVHNPSENNVQGSSQSRPLTSYSPGDTITDTTDSTEKTLVQDYYVPSSSFSKLQAESGLLLGSHPSWTGQPESPTKVSNLSGIKSFGWMGNVRRKLGSIRKSEVTSRPHSVSLEPASLAQRSAASSPTKHHEMYGEDRFLDGPDIPRRAVSASSTILKRKQGAKDWGAKRSSVDGGKLIRGGRLDGAVPSEPGGAGDSRNSDSPDLVDYGEDEDWDVEAAAEGRLVQVTFTVPKEKLRVVNVGDADDIDDDSAEEQDPLSADLGGGKASD